jgi:preprotein translocase SecE subunit
MKLNKKSAPKVVRHKAPETVRERATKQLLPRQPKSSKLRNKIYRPLSVLRRVAAKEFNPVKVPQKGRFGRILGKRFNLIPGFITNAWKELRQVNWPSRKDALRMTFAVIVFAVVFAIFVQVFGILFEKLFKFILTS